MKWIKIKDKLPGIPEAGCIPVIIDSWSDTRQKWHISYAEWKRGNFYDRYNERVPIDNSYWEITHWMTLPEPPK